LNNHANDITNYLSLLDRHFDIYGFSETWFNYESDSSSVGISGYSSVNSIRQDRAGGGASLFINPNINYRERNDLILDCDHCDSVFIEINSKSSNIIVGIVYKPEYVVFDDFINQLSRTLDTISNEKKTCYLMGDFNIDLLKYDNSPKVKQFVNLFFSHDYFPCIDRPSRVSHNHFGDICFSLIDNIFCNDVTINHKSGLIITDISDHFPTFTTSKGNRFITPLTPTVRKSRQLKPENIKGLNNALSLTNWDLVYDTDNPEEAYNLFNDKLLNQLDIHCPLKLTKNNRRNTPKKPWITKGLLTSIKTKDKLYKRFLSKPNDNNKQVYTKYRCHLTSLLRIAKKSYYTNQIELHNNDMKKMWSTLNNLLGRNKQVKLPDFFIDTSGNKISRAQDIANKFNDFFTSIGASLANKIPPPTGDFQPQPMASLSNSLFLSPTTPDELMKLSAKLKSSHSSGIDGISSILLKSIIKNISTILSHIFNLSINSGIVPTKLKIAKVTPIFKSGDSHDFSNYRPISILPAISKLLEKVIYNRIYNFISTHNILTPYQFGFRQKRSTLMAINELYCRIAHNLDSKLHTIGIFLDLSKAFDTLNHRILLNKLNAYGIRGVANDWISSYLHDRKQYVVFNQNSSDLAPITCGVPQGSILGPLLFLLYINDLPLCSKNADFILFADDTNILFSHQDHKILENIINNEMNVISNWFKMNKLSLNVKKTNFMIFKNKHSPKKVIEINIFIDNNKIEKVTTTKFLGVLIDDNLSWKSHTSHICKIISKYNGIIRKVRPFLPQSSLSTLYNTFVLPYISYCNVIWADKNNSQLESVFLLQKRVIRTCTNSLWLAHTDPLFNFLNTLKVYDIYSLQLGTFMFQYHHGLLPEDMFINIFFQTNESVHEYNTRHAMDLHVKTTKTKLAENTICIQGALLWNSLPNLIKNCCSVSSFKRALKYHLIGSYDTI